MRRLWPLERAVLDAAARDYPSCAEAIERQAAVATVTAFENTGAGFLSSIAVDGEVTPISSTSTLDAAVGNVNGVKDAMAFLVFLRDGKLAMIEGYCAALDSTADLNFQEVSFDLKPWGEAQRNA